MAAIIDTTTHLDLPLLLPSQAQKHISHNEALARLDLLVQAAVLGAGMNSAPDTPTEGARYIIGPSPTGLWAGQAGKIAAHLNGNWDYLTPQTGWQVYDNATGTVLIYEGGAWRAPADRALRADRLGVGTDADAVNRLSVSGAASLLSHAGHDHRLKINKASPSDTASLLFQSNWSGRAEMGLAGQDHFSIKVSADGSSFTEALRIEAESGCLTGAGVMAGPQDDSQGRLMVVGAFGLGADTPPQITNWDTEIASRNGFVTGDEAALGQAPPLGGERRAGLSLAASHAGVQRGLLIQHVGAGDLALRGYEEGSPLTGWLRLYGQGNILGTVSQTAGLPTGALFEEGQDALDGHFRRYADGRLECLHSLTSLSTGPTSWSYPSPFASPPLVFVTPISDGFAAPQLEAAPTATLASFSLRNASGARLALPCQLMAVGRWF